MDNVCHVNIHIDIIQQVCNIVRGFRTRFVRRHPYAWTKFETGIRAVFSVVVTPVEIFFPIRMSGRYKSARYEKPSKQLLVFYIEVFMWLFPYYILPPKCLTESQKQPYNLNRFLGFKNVYTCNCVVENNDGGKNTQTIKLCAKSVCGVARGKK